jgi:hypothetical protein
LISGAPQIVPSGGGFKYERDGQFAEGFDRESLINALTNYRIVNNLPFGDPEKDVDAELLRRCPTYHPPIPTGFIAPRGSIQERSLLERCRDWLANRRIQTNALSYVSPQEADKRAAICVKCEHNIEWRNSCAACIPPIEMDIVKLTKNRRTQLHDSLKGCYACGHLNQAAVWLDAQSLASSRLKKTPKFCWLNKLN